MGKRFNFTGEKYGLTAKSSVAIIPVCIGWQNSEGNKFADFVADARGEYGTIVFVLADDLYAYVEAIINDTKPEDELVKARKRGAEWQARNPELIGNSQVLPWRYFEQLEFYDDCKKTIEERFNDDKFFRGAVGQTIIERTNNPKYKTRLDIFDFSQKSVKYVLDECIKYLCWSKQGYHFVIHPDPLSVALKYVYENLISPNNKNCAIFHQGVENKVKPISQPKQLKIDRSSPKMFKAVAPESPEAIFPSEISNVFMSSILFLFDKLTQDKKLEFKSKLDDLIINFSPNKNVIINILSKLTNLDVYAMFFLNEIGHLLKSSEVTMIKKLESKLIKVINFYTNEYINLQADRKLGSSSSFISPDTETRENEEGHSHFSPT